MPKLRKVSLLGVRSFSPHETESAELSYPLTLITGHNGAGKTTVVEALRMACTGELPPNCNKGHNFVHDPELAQLGTVRAQIRLIFEGDNGTLFSIHRNFQLSQVKKKSGDLGFQFKQAEAALACQKPDGSRHQISSRCADIDSQIPSLLGMSKPILDSVVFVHQEDSLWPLADQSKLKKRFDDLFGSMEYSKALSNLNQLRTEISRKATEAAGEAKVQFEIFSQEREMSKQVQMSETRLKDIEDRRVNKENEYQAATAEAATFKSRLAELQLFRDRSAGMETNIFSLEAERATILARLTPDANLPEGDVDQLCELMLGKQAERKRIDATSASAAASLMELEREAEALQDERIRLASSNERLAEEQARLDGMGGIMDVINTRWLGDDEETSPQSVSSRAERISRRVLCCLVKAEEESRQCITSAESRTKILDMEARQLGNQLSRIQEEDERMASSRTEVNRVKKELDELVQREGGLEKALTINEEKERQTNKGLTAATEAMIEANAAVKKLEDVTSPFAGLEGVLEPTRTAEAIVANLQQEVKGHSEALMISTRKSAATLGIKNPRSEKASVVSRIETARTKLSTGEWEVLESIHGVIIDSVGDEGNIMPMLEMLSVCGKKWGDNRASYVQQETFENKCIAAANAAVGAASDRLHAIKERQERAMNFIREGLPDLDLLSPKAIVQAVDDEWQRATAHEDHCRSGLIKAQNAQHIYTSYLDESRRRNRCGFCDRDFGDVGIKKMEKNIDTRLKQIPKTLKRAATQHEAAKEALDALRGVVKGAEQLGGLEAELKTATEEFRLTQEEVARLENESNHSKSWMNKYSKFADLFSQVSGPADQIYTSIKKMEEIRDSIKKNVARLPGGREGLERFIKADQKLSAARERAMSCKGKVIDLRSEASAHVSKVSGLKQEMDNVKSRKESLYSSKNAAEALLACSDEKKPSLKRLRKEAKAADELSSSARELLFKLRSDISMKQNGAKADQEALLNVKNAALSAEKRIGELNSPSSANRLQIIETEISFAKKRVADARFDISKLQDERENVDASVLLLERCCALARLDQRLVESRTSLNALKEDFRIQTSDGLVNESEKAAARVDEASSGLHGLTGERTAVQRFLTEQLKSLDKEKFTSCHERLVHSRVENILRKEQHRGLTEYAAAVDRALMQYHQSKLEELNVILKELWRMMYRGNDAEYLAVRSDTEQKVKGSGTRNYNYRLVMGVKGHELDMRGRCSAGQRVLACIVVRLALAECFCSTCGLMVLDEPTTNLDSENAAGLAAALGSLLTNRQRQKDRLQLILITHDTEFVHLLGRYQIADNFIEVKKDASGHSRITRHELTL